MSILKSHFLKEKPSILDNERVEKFLAKVEERRHEELLEMQAAAV
jgi:hypothetical protein